MHFQLTKQPIELQNVRQALLNKEAGAYCAFEGWVRNHHLGKAVTALQYDAYEPLALKSGQAVLQAAAQKFPLLEAKAIHRLGPLRPGDLAVYVGVCSAHRDTAFAACQYIIDAIKANVPIWKFESYNDGTQVWVDPTACHCGQKAKAETSQSARQSTLKNKSINLPQQATLKNEASDRPAHRKENKPSKQHTQAVPKNKFRKSSEMAPLSTRTAESQARA